MLYHLLYPLTPVIGAFNVFQYITFRAAYAGVTSLLICFLLGPKFIALLKRRAARERIRSDVPDKHQEKSGVPTMGGVLIVIAIIASSLLWMNLRAIEVWLPLIALIGFGAIGFADDYVKTFSKESNGLSFAVKLSLQVGAAIIMSVMLYLLRNGHTTLLFLPFLKEAVADLGLFYIPAVIILLVATTNAVNLTDGLDGLATGLVMMVAITFTVLAYVSGRVDFSEYLHIPYISGGAELTILCFAIVGACIGFLWFNSHPAEIFMGDTGSLSLGAVIGMVALLLKKELLLVICGGVFVLEAASVILQVASYKLRRKRIFRMAPLHHHFELLGWPESKVVLRFWIIGVLFAVISLSTVKVQ